MKLKTSCYGIAASAMLLGFGCSQESPKNVDKGDAVLKAAPKESVVADKVSATKGEVKQVDPKQVAQDIASKAPSAFPGMKGAPPKGKTLKEFFATLDLPEIVAVVGDKKITKEDLVKDIEGQIPPQMRNQPLPPQITAGMAQNLKTVVDTMISRRLLLNLAKADGIVPSAKMLTDKFDSYLATLTPDKRAEFEKRLEANGSSIEKQKKEASGDLGAQEAVAIDKWIETVIMPKIKSEDNAAEKYYRENQEKFKKPGTTKVAHILITPERPDLDKMSKMSDDEKKKAVAEADLKAKAKADAIYKKVKAGGDFAKLAKENSVCPSGKSDGGQLPEFDKSGAIAGAGPRGGAMDKVFTDASYKLKVGEISEPVKTNFGYHIIKSINKSEESYVPFDQVKEYLTSNLKKEQLGKAVKDMIDAEKERCNVKIFVK